MVDRGKKTSIVLKLVLVQIFWAGTFVASEIALHEQPAATTAAVRFVVTTACYVALCLVSARQREPLWPRLRDLPVRDWAVLAAMGFFGVAAYTILLHLGLRHSTAANAALLIPTTQPVFTALLGAAVLGERPPAKLWLGLGLGLVGAILVISHDAGGSVALSSNVLIVLSAFAFSCYASPPSSPRTGWTRSRRPPCRSGSGWSFCSRCRSCSASLSTLRTPRRPSGCRSPTWRSSRRCWPICGGIRP